MAPTISPFALSLSKRRPFFRPAEVQGFDKLSPNGLEVSHD